MSSDGSVYEDLIIYLTSDACWEYIYLGLVKKPVRSHSIKDLPFLGWNLQISPLIVAFRALDFETYTVGELTIPDSVCILIPD